MKAGAFVALLAAACSIASGCGAIAKHATAPPAAEQQTVARHFAQAIFRGNTHAAVALLIHPEDKALSSFVAESAAPWRAQHGSIRLPATRSGSQWIFGYAGTHDHANGTFQQVQGDIAVSVTSARGTAGVELFMIRKNHVRYGTHHDSVLLPSNR